MSLKISENPRTTDCRALTRSGVIGSAQVLRRASSYIILSSHCIALLTAIQSSMLGLTARRAVCSRSKCLASSALPAGVVTATQQWHSANPRNRTFHSTTSNAAFRPTWMPMRVKTPWIDALTQSRQEAGNAGKAGEQGAPSFEPDLTPKKMSDSYYSAVCMNTHFEDDCADC